MHSTGHPVSQSGVGYVVQFFSLASYFLHAENRHLSVHHGHRPSGVLNSVLVQNFLRFCQKKCAKKHTQKNIIKMCSILRPKATKNQY